MEGGRSLGHGHLASSLEAQAMPASLATELPRAYVRFARTVPRQDALRIATEAARAADGKTQNFTRGLSHLPVWFLTLTTNERYRCSRAVSSSYFLCCARTSPVCFWRAARRVARVQHAVGIGCVTGTFIRQAFVESSVLGALGVVTGIAVAWMLVSLSRAFLPEAFLLRTLNPLNIDARALAVTSYYHCRRGCAREDITRLL